MEEQTAIQIVPQQVGMTALEIREREREKAGCLGCHCHHGSHGSAENESLQDQLPFTIE